MSESLRYCQHCGAANATESQTCFACQHPLAEQEEMAQGIVLHGRYQLLTQVGSGGFGGVYRAVDIEDEGRVVAVKQITLRGLSTQEAIEATDGFNREVSLLSTLHYPHLPTIRDTFTDPEHWYVVMDFIEGETLEAYLKGKPRGRLSLPEALEIGIQLCAVLRYLHSRKPAIIFRDLKPGNVMYTPGKQIYLIDFGIARLFSPGKARDTMPFGSPGYAAPEQYGRAQTDVQADIYSLGALLHYLLTGNDPADSPFRFAPLSTEPAELATLIQRMVATAPEERPASALVVQEVLQRLASDIRQGERESPFSRPAPNPSALTRRSMLGRGLKIGAGITVGVAVVGACGIGFNALRRPPVFYGTVAEVPPSPPVPKQAFIYRGHSGPITALSWSPDGTMVASGSADETVQVWRTSDGRLLYTLHGYTQPVTCISWASDRPNVIASAGNNDGTVQVWDALRDHRDRTWQGDGRVLALDWKSHSPWIVSGGTDQDIYTWNATTGQQGATYDGHKGNVNAVVWLPGNNATASNGAVSGFASLANRDLDPTPTPPPPGPTPTPPPMPTPPPPGPTPTPPGFISFDNAVASGGDDGTVQIWDASTGKNIFNLDTHTSGSINGLAAIHLPPYYGQGSYLAVAKSFGPVEIWTLFPRSNPESSFTFLQHKGPANAVTALAQPVTYYNQLIASASDDKTVRVWSISSRTTLITYTAHQAPVRAVAASPVDNRIVSGDSNGLIHLWTLQGAK